MLSPRLNVTLPQYDTSYRSTDYKVDLGASSPLKRAFSPVPSFRHSRSVPRLLRTALLAFLILFTLTNPYLRMSNAASRFLGLEAPPPAPHKHVDTDASNMPTARIIKATMAYGKGALYKEYEGDQMDKLRERTLEGHFEHAKRHGYRQVVQRSDIMGNMYSKPAMVLNLLLEEMSKPEGKRAEWIMAHDSDVIVMNRDMKIETFLPPKDKDYNLLVTNDFNGLNTGVFMIRVCTWSVKLMSANVAYESMPNARPHNYMEQGALGNLLEDSAEFKAKTVYIPQAWINAYPTEGADGWKAGGLQVHLVFMYKKETEKWLKMSESRSPRYEMSAKDSGIQDEIDQFWKAH